MGWKIPAVVTEQDPRLDVLPVADSSTLLNEEDQERPRRGRLGSRGHVAI